MVRGYIVFVETGLNSSKPKLVQQYGMCYVRKCSRSGCVSLNILYNSSIYLSKPFNRAIRKIDYSFDGFKSNPRISPHFN